MFLLFGFVVLRRDKVPLIVLHPCSILFLPHLATIASKFLAMQQSRPKTTALLWLDKQVGLF